MALVALASASLTAFSADTLAAYTSLACFSSASLRALVVVLSLASNEVTRARALARETINKTIWKVKRNKKGVQGKNQGNKDTYPWIRQQFYESQDIQRQEIKISALKAKEPKRISKATASCHKV
jgi:hypothetical protein